MAKTARAWLTLAAAANDVYSCGCTALHVFAPRTQNLEAVVRCDPVVESGSTAGAASAREGRDPLAIDGKLGLVVEVHNTPAWVCAPLNSSLADCQWDAARSPGGLSSMKPVSHASASCSEVNSRVGQSGLFSRR